MLSYWKGRSAELLEAKINHHEVLSFILRALVQVRGVGPLTTIDV